MKYPFSTTMSIETQKHRWNISIIMSPEQLFMFHTLGSIGAPVPFVVALTYDRTSPAALK